MSAVAERALRALLDRSEGKTGPFEGTLHCRDVQVTLPQTTEAGISMLHMIAVSGFSSMSAQSPVSSTTVSVHAVWTACRSKTLTRNIGRVRKIQHRHTANGLCSMARPLAVYRYTAHVRELGAAPDTGADSGAHTEHVNIRCTLGWHRPRVAHWKHKDIVFGLRASCTRTVVCR